jgi:hypothetical protein
MQPNQESDEEWSRRQRQRQDEASDYSDESAEDEGGPSIRKQNAAPRLAIGQKLFLLACALLIGFVGGRGVAESAGAILPDDGVDRFDHRRDLDGLWIFIATVVLAFFVVASLRFLILLGQRVAGLLARVETRPDKWITVTIIVCGVLCLLAAVALQWHHSSVSASVSVPLPQIGQPGIPPGMMQGGAISVRARSSLMTPITTIGVLLAGLAITAVGIWSGIPTRRSLASKDSPTRQGGAGRSEPGNTQTIRVEPIPVAGGPLD